MIALITGYDKNKLIGNGPNLPWHISDDLNNFKEVTSGCTMIMGLTTFKSIGKALPNRVNIVMSFEKIDLPGAIVVTSIDEALTEAKKTGKQIFIMGGASIYKMFLPIVDKLYISHIKGDHKGDIYFPAYDESEWVPEHRKDFKDFEFVIYKRKL